MAGADKQEKEMGCLPAQNIPEIVYIEQETQYITEYVKTPMPNYTIYGIMAVSLIICACILGYFMAWYRYGHLDASGEVRRGKDGKFVSVKKKPSKRKILVCKA